MYDIYIFAWVLFLPIGTPKYNEKFRAPILVDVQNIRNVFFISNWILKGCLSYDRLLWKKYIITTIIIIINYNDLNKILMYSYTLKVNACRNTKKKVLRHWKRRFRKFSKGTKRNEKEQSSRKVKKEKDILIVFFIFIKWL